MSKELLHAEELLSKGEMKEALKIIFNFEGTASRYYLEGDFERGIEVLLQCKELYEKMGRESNIANNLINLSRFYSQKGEKNEGLKYAKKSLELYEQLNDRAGIAKSYSLLAYNYGFNINGNLELAIGYATRSLSITDIDPRTKAVNLKNLAIIYSIQGRNDKALQFAEEGYKFAREKNNDYISALCSWLIGNTYQVKGDLDRTIEYFKNSLIHARKSGFIELIGWALFSLTQYYLLLDSRKQAQEYLTQLEETVKLAKDKTTFKLYLTAKGLMLRASGRSRDRAEAEKLFKQIVADEITNPQVYINAVSYLCDLLIEELEISNNSEIINELEPLITSLLQYAEKTHSLIYISLTKGFQAKLALIQMEFAESRHLLTQAQRIAEQHGLQGFAKIFSTDHDKLLEQLNTWEQLKKDNAPMSKRIKLASFDKIITRMKGMNVSETPELETEQPILFTIISKKGSMIFSNPFTADMTFDVNKIGDFLSSFTTFSDQIFSESLDRVKFLDFKLILKEINSFILCYMFKGQSYSAQQKLLNFSKALTNQGNTIKILNTSAQSGHLLSINDIPIIEELISESFLSDPKKFQVPFKSYEGEKPYLFVSYAQVDKLHVYPIIDYLNKAGINIWYDEGIPISENWRKTIVEHIERCKAFLVFITPHILDSDYVQKEINFALKRHKTFFAVYIKETKLPSELEFEISSLQHINKYLLPESKFYDRLKKGLSSLL